MFRPTNEIRESIDKDRKTSRFLPKKELETGRFSRRKSVKDGDGRNMAITSALIIALRVTDETAGCVFVLLSQRINENAFHFRKKHVR